MKILIVDDHPLVREGLRQVLRDLDPEPDILQAGSGAELFALAAQHPDLDLVLLDYHLPDMNGLQAMHSLLPRHASLPILMLSGTQDVLLMREVLSHGASGFVTKTGNSAALLDAVRRVLDGQLVLPREVIRDPLRPVTPHSNPRQLHNFTARQESVLLLLMEGRTNKEISVALTLAEETVKNHVTNILRRLGVQTRLQAVLLAKELGYDSAAHPDAPA